MNAPLESLGWTLLHFCWQAAAIVLIYWAVDLALPRARSQTRYLLSLAALLSMLAAAIATFGYEEARSRAGLPFSSSVGGVSASGISPRLMAFAGAAVQGASNRPARFDLSAMLPWLDVAWFLGVLCLSARTIGGCWWIQRLRRQALVEAPTALRASFCRVRERLGVRQPVDLRISERVPGPLAVGIVRSLILLPASALLALSPEQLEAVLAHELAHVRRADYFWNLMQTMVETLFFFHPAVWWVGKRVREQRELCCDDAAVAACSDPLLYATALLSMEEQRNPRLDLAMAFGGRKSRFGLRARIARVLGEASLESRGAGSISLPLAAICAGFVIFLIPAAQLLGGLRSKTAEAAAQLHSAAPTAPTAAAAPDAPPVTIPGSTESSHDAAAAHVKASQDAARSQASAMQSAEQSRVSGGEDAAAMQAKVTQLKSAQEAILSQALAMESGEQSHISGAEDAAAMQAKVAQLKSAQEAILSQALAMSSAARSRVFSGEDAAAMQAKVAQLAVLNRAIAMGSAEQSDASGSQDAAAPPPTPPTPSPAPSRSPVPPSLVPPDYIEQMRAAGYDVDPGKYVDMKILGVTPEYARAMQKAGLGKPSAEDLIAMKVQGITPDYLAELRAEGLEPGSFRDAITYRIFKLSPQFVAAIKAAGFPSLRAQDMVPLRAEGITPEYAAAMKKQFPDVTVGELIQLRAFKIDDAFIAEAKRHNFSPLTVRTLVRLRISGLLNDSPAGSDKK